MNKYVCLKTCVYSGRIYKEGEALETENTNVPKHFKLVVEATKSTKKK